MELPAGAASETVLVTQIYLGLAQGWYVDAEGEHFGFGRPTPTGWRWWHGEDASRELGQPLQPETLLTLKAIVENPTKAKLISAPLKFENPLQENN
jgi:hypothetical protein